MLLEHSCYLSPFILNIYALVILFSSILFSPLSSEIILYLLTSLSYFSSLLPNLAAT